MGFGQLETDFNKSPPQKKERKETVFEVPTQLWEDRLAHLLGKTSCRISQVESRAKGSIPQKKVKEQCSTSQGALEKFVPP